MLSGLGALAFARPGALWIGLALIPIALLYFLRMRFRRKSVGSTYLWRELAAATTGGDALRRRSILLLLLQAAAVALAAFAAAGPSLVSRSLVEPGVAFLVDVSASMGSRDSPGRDGAPPASRVEAAVVEAAKEIDALGERVPIMTFACSTGAVALLPGPSYDKARAKASLRGLSAGTGGFEEGRCADSIAAALAKAEGSWSAVAFTDGGMDLGGDRLASTFGGSFRAVSVGSGGASVGVTALRLEERGKGRARAVFMLWNGHGSERELKLRLTLKREGSRSGGTAIASGILRAEPGWSRSGLELAGGIEEGGYTLEVERGSGDIEGAPGESCYLSVARQRALRVLLVGRSDPFLKAALAQGGISYSSLASFPADLSTLREASLGQEAAPDIVVVESARIPADLRRNLLVFGAPPPDAPLAPSGVASGALASVAATHPLLRFVSWEGAKASSATGYALRGQAAVLATVGGKPSLVAWEKDGYRSLACGVDLARSDLGLKSAFPVLLRNYIRWCAPRADEQSAYTLYVGETARRLEDESFRLKSSGAELTRSGPAVDIVADSAGLYEWEVAASPASAQEAARGYLAVNVPSGELDAAPRALGSKEPSAGAASSTPATAAVERAGSKPLGPAASALLAILLAAEWVAWNGGARRRGAKAGKPGREGGSA